MATTRSLMALKRKEVRSIFIARQLRACATGLVTAKATSPPPSFPPILPLHPATQSHHLSRAVAIHDILCIYRNHNDMGQCPAKSSFCFTFFFFFKFSVNSEELLSDGPYASDKLDYPS